MRVLTWNVERKKSTSRPGRAGIDLLRSMEADVMVVTEARTTFPADDGHVVHCEPLPYEHLDADERRVLMWSKQPWFDVDTVGHPDLPVGRFVSALTETPLGAVRFVGVCISWHMANVQHGDRNRRPWEDHHRYLEVLPEIFGRYDDPLIVAGDFNQRIPRGKYGNRAAAEAMASTFASLDVVTSGAVDGLERPVIDHIALGADLSADRVWGWPSVVDGTRMSDHSGVAADLISAVS